MMKSGTKTVESNKQSRACTRKIGKYNATEMDVHK